MARPLEGIRVLDMGTFITGPAAGMLLADLGAEVIKIEMPGTGDPFRAFQGDLYSPHYQTYNRNKKSVELNTKDPEDLAALHAACFVTPRPWTVPARRSTTGAARSTPAVPARASLRARRSRRGPPVPRTAPARPAHRTRARRDSSPRASDV